MNAHYQIKSQTQSKNSDMIKREAIAKVTVSVTGHDTSLTVNMRGHDTSLTM